MLGYEGEKSVYWNLFGCIVSTVYKHNLPTFQYHRSLYCLLALRRYIGKICKIACYEVDTSSYIALNLSSPITTLSYHLLSSCNQPKYAICSLSGSLCSFYAPMGYGPVGH